jgi:hypothetical protein
LADFFGAKTFLKITTSVPGATKSTVVGLSAVAGAVCGPAAAACGAGLAVGANAAWDGVDSAIAGENRGIVDTVNKIAGIDFVELGFGRKSFWTRFNRITTDRGQRKIFCWPTQSVGRK